MSDPFLGEVKTTSFTFAPKGWALCNGQLLSIAANQALFSILGTQYGGNGQTTFALPNLQGRLPLHMGNGYAVGVAGGEESHTLTVNELPAHTHQAASASAATSGSPNGAVWAPTGPAVYASTPSTTMAPSTVGNTGGSQPHENRAPFLVVNFIIAVQGVFPSRG